MILSDVSVMVAALRPDHPHHDLAADWYDAAHGSGDLAISSLVIAGTLRVLTNRRIFVEPTPLKAAVAAISAVLEQAPLVHPGARHWEILARLCEASGVVGGDISDAQHAALALEFDATWVTTDSDFGCFPGLRWTNLLTGETHRNV
ncbi:MAG: PIN domain-containing protein [Bifidobacteriaceae bacterium]|nr:PIN domain-containing protein [Bifidobacteriaceae bacterium]